MAYLRDHAIILKSEPFREDDMRVTLYGRAHGKMTALARGARRMSAKLLTHLQPFFEVDVMIAKGAVFDKIAVARVLKPRVAFSQRLSLLAVAGGYVHLIDLLTKPGVPDAAIYDVLRSLVELGDDCTQELSKERARLMLAGATLKLLDFLGYGPRFESSSSLRDDAIRVLHFLRSRPLKDVLYLTAAPTLFVEASIAIERQLAETHLDREPQGVVTLEALLT